MSKSKDFKRVNPKQAILVCKHCSQRVGEVHLLTCPLAKESE